MWVITRAIRQYHQDGDYLFAVYEDKPTWSNLEALFPESTSLFKQHLLNGGGRVAWEDEWFYLVELEEGVEYKDHWEE